jgi:hypothetical protein
MHLSFCDAKSFFFFLRSPPVTGFDDLIIKWDVSKPTSMASSKESDHFLKIFSWIFSA